MPVIVGTTQTVGIGISWTCGEHGASYEWSLLIEIAPPKNKSFFTPDGMIYLPELASKSGGVSMLWHHRQWFTIIHPTGSATWGDTYNSRQSSLPQFQHSHMAHEWSACVPQLQASMKAEDVVGTAARDRYKLNNFRVPIEDAEAREDARSNCKKTSNSGSLGLVTSADIRFHRMIKTNSKLGIRMGIWILHDFAEDDWLALVLEK